MSERSEKSALQYCSGDDIRQGDRVTYAGHAGIVEFVVDGLTGDEARDWYFETHGPGIMVAEPDVFGRVYLTSPETEEDLLFIARPV